MNSLRVVGRARARAVAGGGDFVGKVLFAGAVVDDRGQTARGETDGQLSVTRGRPLLGGPSGAGIEDGDGRARQAPGDREWQLDAGFAGGIAGSRAVPGGRVAASGERPISCQPGLHQLQVLLDDVGGVGVDERSRRASGPWASRGWRKPRTSAGSREARQERGLDCALQVERAVIVAAAHAADGGEEFAPHGGAEGTFAPGAGIDQMKLVEQRTAGAARAGQLGLRGRTTARASAVRRPSRCAPPAGRSAAWPRRAGRAGHRPWRRGAR